MLHYWWLTSPCWMIPCQSIKAWKRLPDLLSLLTVKQTDAKGEEQPALFMLNPLVPVEVELIGRLTC
jgi:hypothetical protein